MANNKIVQGFDDEKDENLTIEIERVDAIEGCLIMYLTGSIDTCNIHFFQKQGIKIIESGYVKLIFHCGGLTSISSTGITAFSLFMRLIKDRNGAMVFFAIHPKVQEVFQVLGFAQVFTITESLDAALEQFQGSESGFPRLLICPVCASPFPGDHPEERFQCSRCKTLLAVDSRGHVFLG